MLKMLNLTQHSSTPDQTGVVEPTPERKEKIQELLTFDAPPTAEEMSYRAHELARIVLSSGEDAAMIGGAPFFMSTLESVLSGHGITPFYAFSKRESNERIVDGKTVKTAVFVHIGYVRAYLGK